MKMTVPTFHFLSVLCIDSNYDKTISSLGNRTISLGKGRVRMERSAELVPFRTDTHGGIDGFDAKG